ncbi:hypothetical protein ACHAWF_015800 [Thalassiosira exigua]
MALSSTCHIRRLSIRGIRWRWDCAIRFSSSVQADGEDPDKCRGSDIIDHDANMNYVRSTMKKWVKNYVVDHKLCPFAEKSDHRIAIWPCKTVNDSADGFGIQPFIEGEINKLLDDTENKNRPNTFVVFPFVKAFLSDVGAFGDFYVDIARSIPGAGHQLDFSNPCKVQFFPFHKDLNWRFKTPWPALHLLRRCDLDRARRGSDEVSTVIREKNEKTLASEDVQRKLENFVLETAKFPDPIQLTKSICLKQKAKLHEEGYRIVEAQVVVEDDKSDRCKKMSSPVRIKRASKKNKGKKKTKPKR